MKRLDKFWWWLLAPRILTVWADGLGTHLTGGLFEDRVLARGPNFEIRESDLDEKFILLTASLASRGEILPESERPNVKNELLKKMVHTQVLIHHATEQDRSAAKTVAERILSDAREQAGSDRQFVLALHAQGLSKEQFEREVQERAICEEVVNRELRSTISVSDQEVRRYYQQNPEKFEEPEKVRIRHLFLPARGLSGLPLDAEGLKKQRQLAETYRQRLKQREDFNLLVSELSRPVEGRNRNGEFVVVRGELTAELDAFAFALERGQISEVITTKYGFHVMELLERRPARRAPLSEVRPRIVNHLTIVQVEEKLPEYLNRLMRAASAEIVRAPVP